MKSVLATTTAAVLLVGLLNGCASFEATTQLPSFDESNAALIDKALSELKISDLVAPVVRKDEKSVVVSMEDRVSKSDSSFNYLVEDNLIAALVKDGRRVLERDENLIVREIPEGNSQYDRSLLRILPTPPSVALMDAIEKNGLSSILKDKKLNVSDVLNFYKQIEDDYAKLVAAQNHMGSADVIISYRLMELGVRATTQKTKIENSSQPSSSGNSQNGVWTMQIRREAMARLFVRVMDAKTGEIRAADILQSVLADSLQLAQRGDESDSDFDVRARSYLAALGKFHYSWFEQQMPNKNGNAEPQTSAPVELPNMTVSPPSSSGGTAPAVSAARPGSIIPLGIGVLLSFSPLEYEDQTVNFSGSTQSLDYSYSSIGPKVFFDFAYGEASVGYRTALSLMNEKLTVTGSSASTNVPFWINLIDLRLVGKYPFTFGSITIFPLAGVTKVFCVNGSLAGSGFTVSDINDWSPWYLLLGAGGDFKIAKQLYARTELTAAYNITSKRSPTYYAGTTYLTSSGWQISLSAGIGFSLN